MSKKKKTIRRFNDSGVYKRILSKTDSSQGSCNKKKGYILTNLKPIIYTSQFIGLVGRVFANSLGDQGSIPGRVISKTLKMVLDTSLLNIHHYKLRMKGPEKVAPSPTSRCISY